MLSPLKTQSYIPCVGDEVLLPEGQTGILRYIGSIDGKAGEFAGVELCGKYEGKGRHNGAFQGVKYFTTKKPYSGLFISWPKLLNNVNSTRQIAANEISLGSPTALRSGGSMSSAMGRRQQQPRIPLMPRTPDRVSLSSSPTRLNYSRESISSTVGSIRRPSSIARSSITLAPTIPVGGGRQLGTHGPANESFGSINLRFGSNAVSTSQRLFSPSSASLSSAASAPLDNRDPSETFKQELMALTMELERLDQTTNEKDLIIQQQSQLIKDLETSIVEFQTLSSQYENLEGENSNLLRLNEEKDRKLSMLRMEFEDKRAEFRHTTDSLQDTLQSYEVENEDLKQHMAEHGTVIGQLAELQKMVLELEQQRDSNSQTSNNRVTMVTDGDGAQTVLDINYFATVENKLLEKDETIKALKEELEELRSEIMAGDNDKSTAVITKLTTSLESTKQQVSEKETQIAALQEQLSEEVHKPSSVDPTVDKQLGTLKQTVDAKNKEIKELKASFRQTKYMEEELKELKYQFNEVKQELNQSKDALTKKENSLTELKTLYDSRVKTEPVLESKEPIIHQNELNQLKQLLEKEVEQRRKLQEEVLSMKPAISQEEFNRLKEQLEKEAQQRQNLEGELRRMETVIEGKALQESLLEKEIESLHIKGLSLNDLSTTTGIDMVTPPLSSVAKQDPAAGRSLWCGLCERSGHESIDCPFEGEEF